MTFFLFSKYFLIYILKILFHRNLGSIWNIKEIPLSLKFGWFWQSTLHYVRKTAYYHNDWPMYKKWIWSRFSSILLQKIINTDCLFNQLLVIKKKNKWKFLENINMYCVSNKMTHICLIEFFFKFCVHSAIALNEYYISPKLRIEIYHLCTFFLLENFA